MSQKNTLFNYFQRAKPSPEATVSSSPATKGGSKSAHTPSATPKRTDSGQHGVSGSQQEWTPSATPKRGRTERSGDGSGKQKKYRRLRLISDDEDSENDGSLANGARAANAADDGESGSEEQEHQASPLPMTPSSQPSAKSSTSTPFSRASPATPRAAASPVTPRSVGSATKSKLASFAAEGEAPSSGVGADDQSWPHLALSFLDPARMRDAAGRRPSDEEYNPRTLRVPADFLDKQTPAMRQWWELKAQYWDCVLFFKMGKFYEMFHMDAVLCVKELGLLYMKGDHAHVGFPEASYGRYSSALVEKGWRVCRVEQTETPEMMQQRCANSTRRQTKFDKVVSREVCQLTTRGTRTFSAVEGDAADSELHYLLAIREQEVSGVLHVGVCFVDTSVGHFRLGQFSDDCHCSRLRTVLAHFPPAQVLLVRSADRQRSREALLTLPSTCLRDTLRQTDEFWDAEKTLRYLTEADYFRPDGDETKSDEQTETGWPSALLQLCDGEPPQLRAGADSSLALQCLGAVVWYLKRSLLDTQLLSMRRFSLYTPPDAAAETPETSGGEEEKPEERRAEPQTDEAHATRMVLDGMTVRNLELLQNSADGGTDGTLLSTLDTCVTAFGKRVLRAWVCAPLRSAASIAARQDAVDELLSQPQLVDELSSRLKQLPDLERTVRRIHVQGNWRLGAESQHPEARAIMFEQERYSRSRVNDLLTAISGFREAADMVLKLGGAAAGLESHLLRCCLTLRPAGGRFPDYAAVLDYFDASFDQEEARRDGRIVPADGVDEPSDAARRELDQVQRELDDYLQEQCRHFGCKVTYFGTARNRFQLEVPDRAVHRVDDSYELQTQRKGARRYWTPRCRQLLARCAAAEQAQAAALRDVARRMFGRFAAHAAAWEQALRCLAMLDSLLALARFSGSCETSCRPQLVDQPGVLELTEAGHPWLGRSAGGEGGGQDFIPNSLSCGRSRVLLITGPNMGGKSTLMRQAGLLVILAQLGCRVPAESMRLCPVDRVFTRLGAQDRIMLGESTFHVELSETAAILQHATARSLVLLDELGRGTSTFDGSAIASAVLRRLLRTECVCLFSTHYHSIVEEFSANPQVWLGHMSCMVENENEEDPTQETITFLYRLTDGACPKSYGFNAARLAGLPAPLVRAAHAAATHFERRVERLVRFSALWQSHSQPVQAG